MTAIVTEGTREAHRRAHVADVAGAKLDALRNHGMHVLHSVSIGAPGCDIDHLIIGPAGVFAVNTKQHPGSRVTVVDHALMVNGDKVPYLRKVKFEAERTATLLGRQVHFSVPVRGCIVILAGSFSRPMDFASRPIGVSVLGKRDLPRWFSRQPAILTNDQVEALFDAARRSSTWG